MNQSIYIHYFFIAMISITFYEYFGKKYQNEFLIDIKLPTKKWIASILLKYNFKYK